MLCPLQALGHLRDDVILLLRPESFRVLLSCADQGFCYLIRAGITKFKYERKNLMDSGCSSKMMPSCKWSISLVVKLRSVSVLVGQLEIIKI